MTEQTRTALEQMCRDLTVVMLSLPGKLSAKAANSCQAAYLALEEEPVDSDE